MSSIAQRDSDHGLLIQVVASRESDREVLSQAVMESPGVRLIGSVPFDLAVEGETLPKAASILATVRSQSEMTQVRAIASRDPGVVVVALYAIGSGEAEGTPRSAEEFKNSVRTTIANLLTTPEQLRMPLSEADRADREKYDLLTPREREVLVAIAEGLSGREIAGRLFRSEKTIDRHRSSLMSKLGLHDRVALARFAYRLGLSRP